MTYKGFNVSSVEAVLMLDILVELNSIKEKLQESKEPLPETIPLTPEVEILNVDEPATTIASVPKKVCKACGGTHDRPIDYAVCARKNKKD